jgi:TPR repeat protein
MAGDGLGKLIRDISDPYELEIHKAIESTAGPTGSGLLTPYILRAHDRQLRQLVAGDLQRSCVIILVGGSSSGKTRACWEAVRDLPQGWRLWHPISPSRPEALSHALREGLVMPRTVIWLNELQFYLDTGSTDLGEHNAAGLRELVRSSAQGPVLVAGTLWPEYWDVLTRYPRPGTGDTHSQARELLVGHRVIVPETFGRDDLSTLSAEAADDPRIIEATQRPDGRVAQYLAGGFELLGRYGLAPPEARSLIDAAIDYRRFGGGSHIPENFLLAAVPGYIDDNSWDNLGEDWFNKGIEYASRQCLGVPGPLTKIRARPHEAPTVRPVYRLSDYLEEAGRKERRYIVPPRSFWDAAADCEVGPSVLDLAYEAEARARFRLAADLYVRAAVEGNPEALIFLSDHRVGAGDPEAAEKLLYQAAGQGLTEAWISLAGIRETAGDTDAAENFLQKAGADHFALRQRARLRVLAGDTDAALLLLEEAVELGSTDAMFQLAQLLEDTSGDSARIEDLRKRGVESDTMKELKQAADAVRYHEQMIAEHADNVVRAGSESEENLQAALKILDEEEPDFNLMIGRMEKNLGHVEDARLRFARAIDNGSMKEDGTNPALTLLAEIIRDSGDVDDAERLQKYGLEIDGTISEPWTPPIGGASGGGAQAPG